MSTCPDCAQQRYPDKPWTNETNPMWAYTAIDGVTAMIREHDGAVRVLGGPPEEAARIRERFADRLA